MGGVPAVLSHYAGQLTTLCLPIVPIAGRLPGARAGGLARARRANGGLRLRVTAERTMGLGLRTKLTYWDYSLLL